MTQMECRPGPFLLLLLLHGAHIASALSFINQCAHLLPGSAPPLHSSTEGEVIHQYSGGYVDVRGAHKQFLWPQ